MVRDDWFSTQIPPRVERRPIHNQFQECYGIIRMPNSLEQNRPDTRDEVRKQYFPPYDFALYLPRSTNALNILPYDRLEAFKSYFIHDISVEIQEAFSR